MTSQSASRAVRRTIVVLIGVFATGTAPPASAAASTALCHLRLPLTLSTSRHQGPQVSTLRFDPGSVSCNGYLGQWLVVGQHTESTVTGTLKLARPSAGPSSTSQGLLGGHLRLWAQAPRFAWFHASLVTFVSDFSLRQVGDVVRLRGHGHLVPTFKSPAVGSFTATGVASLSWRSPKSAAPRRRQGTLTLDFALTTLPAK
jgi:hypothetical protein